MLDSPTLISQLEAQGFPRTASYVYALGKEARTLSIKYGVQQDYEGIFNLLLSEAVRVEPLFDDSKGNTFLTFLRKPLRHLMQKTYGYSTSSIKLYNQIKRYIKQYEETKGVIPDVPTIAKGLDMTTTKVCSVFIGKPHIISTDALSPEVLSSTMEDPVELLLEGLNPEDRQLIFQRYIEEFTINELSLMYGTHPHVLKKRIENVLRQLRV
jgi:DNA-directed RNA polymerase specialized sigma24 family protein